MTAILSAESVAIRYGAASDAQSHLAVRDISLEIQAGAAFGLIGESGSGKTSLARTLAGLQTPSAGRVVFDGETLTAACRPFDGAFSSSTRTVRRLSIRAWPTGAARPSLPT
jgi:ABC-type glutathione transport system ATPase component